MLRALCATTATVALLTTALAPPAAAVASTTGAEAAHALPAPTGGDTDGDGIAVSRTDVDLAAPPATTSVSLEGAPEQVVLEDVPVGTHLAVRSENAGRWSAWTEVEATPDEAPDDAAPSSTTGIGPIWLGDDAATLELVVVEGTPASIGVVGLHLVDQPAPAATALSAQATAATSGAGGFIHRRSEWATSSMTWACSSGPTAASELRAFVVHHSAGTNDYSAADVPGIIRGIWYYHVQSRGWCDVAYNFVVDKYGGIWEGRQGGVDRPIIGGHTYGFNTGTTAAVQLGTYDTASTPAALSSATTRLIGWRLGVAGIDPTGSTTVTNRTGSTFRGVPNGGQVPVRTVVGHRDLGSTACPGESTYTKLGAYRSGAETAARIFPLHEAFLRRTPTQDDFTTWRKVATTGSLRDVALAMARSAEYSGLIIDDLYTRVLGRLPDDDGRDYWLDELASGTRVEEVGVYFYGSAEYYRSTGSPEGYVQALYRNLLHRDADADGLSYWAGRLRAGTSAPPDVATGFYASIESRRDRVSRLYRRFLGRNPDPEGREYWAAQLLDTDDVLLAVELSVSDEFFRRNLS